MKTTLLPTLLLLFLTPSIAHAQEKQYARMPWHLVDLWWDLGKDVPFESYSIDVTISRSTTLKQATNITGELWQTAKGLFDAWPFQPVRLIGVTAERLTAGEEQHELSRIRIVRSSGRSMPWPTRSM